MMLQTWQPFLRPLPSPLLSLPLLNSSRAWQDLSGCLPLPAGAIGWNIPETLSEATDHCLICGCYRPSPTQPNPPPPPSFLFCPPPPSLTRSLPRHTPPLSYRFSPSLLPQVRQTITSWFVVWFASGGPPITSSPLLWSHSPILSFFLSLITLQSSSFAKLEIFYSYIIFFCRPFDNQF